MDCPGGQWTSSGGGVTEIAKCPSCGSSIDSMYVKSWCPNCEVALPKEITDRLRVVDVRREGEAPGTSHGAAVPAPSNSPIVNRYKDGYRVGTALVALGDAIKIAGALVAAIIVLVSLNAGNNSFGGGGGVAWTGIVGAVIVGGLFWVCGVFVAAQGQILRAVLDNAVASSPFLGDGDRADAMNLPRNIASGIGAPKP